MVQETSLLHFVFCLVFFYNRKQPPLLMPASPRMLSRPKVYQYLSSSVAVSVGNEAYYIAPSIFHDGQDSIETKRENGWMDKTRWKQSHQRLEDGRHVSGHLLCCVDVPATSPSPSGTSSLFSAKDSQILLIGRV